MQVPSVAARQREPIKSRKIFYQTSSVQCFTVLFSTKWNLYSLRREHSWTHKLWQTKFFVIKDIIGLHLSCVYYSQCHSKFSKCHQFSSTWWKLPVLAATLISKSSVWVTGMKTSLTDISKLFDCSLDSPTGWKTINFAQMKNLQFVNFQRKLYILIYSD